MKDRRVEVFRIATLGLLESLDAVVRLARWGNVEVAPEPLLTSVGKLPDRLGVAARLTSETFKGSPVDAGLVTRMCAAMKRLDTAYVTYRNDVESSPERAGDAATALELELAATADGLSPLDR